MRRPQTKTPYAYYRHGTRNRGRPVHRIYAVTVRGPMQGLFGYNDGSTGPPYIAYKNLAGFTWAMQTDQFTDIGAQAWADMKASASPGTVWNKGRWLDVGGHMTGLWNFPCAVTDPPNWLDLFHGGAGIKGLLDWSDLSGPIETIPS